MVFPKCNACMKSIKTKIYRMIPGTAIWNIIVAELGPSGLRFNTESVICNTCYQKYHPRIVVEHKTNNEVCQSQQVSTSQFQIHNTLLPKVDMYLKISCAILNAYFKPLTTDNQAAIELANYMLERSKVGNKFHTDLDNFRMLTDRSWKLTPIREIEGFPKLSNEDLRDITVGIFQLKQAPSYTSLHLNKSLGIHKDITDYEIYAHPIFSGILHVKMLSRHKSGKVYKVFIGYYPFQNDPRAVWGYYCTCQVGDRTLGTCSHVASVLWLLGYALPNENIPEPAGYLGDKLLNLRLQ